MTVDDLVVSTDSEHAEFMALLSKKHGNFARDVMALTMQSCLTTVEMNRFRAYEREAAKAPPGTAFVSDISQNIEYRRRVGPILPTLCQSSLFYSYTKQRFLTPTDMMLSQGWHLPSDKLYGDLAPDGHQLATIRTAKKVFGQGMHLAQVGALFLFLSSYTMRREDAIALVPLHPALSSGDLEDLGDLD
jgi:hypothetical protein